MCAAFRESCIEGEVFLFQQVLHGFLIGWSCNDLVADVLLCAVIVTKLASFLRVPSGRLQSRPTSRLLVVHEISPKFSKMVSVSQEA